MAGKSPQLIDLQKRIRTRIETKTAELADIERKMENLKTALATLEVQRAALILGIDEDEALLKDAAPKTPRTRKAKVKTLGQQMGTDAQEGQA